MVQATPPSPQLIVVVVVVVVVVVLDVLVLVLLLLVVELLVVGPPPEPASLPPPLIRLRSTEATSSQPLDAEATAAAASKIPLRMVVRFMEILSDQKESTPTAPPPLGPA
jgi:hypothetical protein